jgi:RimJ/RimL family protein N-acetyltransferase
MERIDMRREGHMRKSPKWQDAWLDEYAYALRREEWRCRAVA